MKFNIFRLILIITLFLGVGIIVSWLYQKPKATNSVQSPIQNEQVNLNSEQTALPVDQLKKQYVQELEQEEQAIWQELEQLDFSKAQCEKVKRQHAQKYQSFLNEIATEDTQPLKNQKIISLIHTVCHDFNLDPNTIQILSFDDISPAASNDRILIINEKLFEQYDHKIQKFIIGHELVHILYKDHSTRFAMAHMLKPSNEYNHPTNKLRRFHERRADMYCALQGSEYTACTLMAMKEFMQEMGDNVHATHPKTSIRLAKAQELVTTMQIQVA